ncbi:hypothetical protein Taro_024760 [Colocasia esculenta]|uniref:Uncharacterized protein n=1 Tax=Colocasia esculenta TaxID=4460 RepID=A0A843VLB2_COLES|nr:hypothetical protein [Colocasia esculenta]
MPATQFSPQDLNLLSWNGPGVNLQRFTQAGPELIGSSNTSWSRAGWPRRRREFEREGDTVGCGEQSPRAGSLLHGGGRRSAGTGALLQVSHRFAAVYLLPRIPNWRVRRKNRRRVEPCDGGEVGVVSGLWCPEPFPRSGEGERSTATVHDSRWQQVPATNKAH